MRLLIVAEEYPMFDKNSGSLRFLRILEALSSAATVHFYHCALDRQICFIGQQEVDRYHAELTNRGINVCPGRLPSILVQNNYDFIFFEFYGPALRYIDIARYYQPHAKMVVDTVDVHFKRIFSKYDLEGNPKDLREARRVRRKELMAYGKADIVITVTADDRDTLLAENPLLNIDIIPNIHECPPLQEKEYDADTLLFIGGFRHNPNTDAVLYFINEILPIIRQEIPHIRFMVVGDSPPDEITKLASSQIMVTGYVPDTTPYLEQAAVSVAPLRFGAGMKGKIGEAMAYGTPVVTTSVGAEGFGMKPGRDVLVADNPQVFASCVVQLLRNADFYKQVRLNGWRFIHGNYSWDVVKYSIVTFAERMRTCHQKRLSTPARLAIRLQSLLGS